MTKIVPAAIRTFFIGLSSMVIGCATAHAQAAEGVDGQALVDRFLTTIRTMNGRFEQTLVDADGVVIEESSGTLVIERPGKFRWAYAEPYEQVLVADGLNVWSYDVDLAQVTVKPQAEVLGSTPASLLGGSADALRDFEFIGSDEDRGTTWVQLRPSGQESSFRQIDLGFSGDQLSRMIFTDNLDQSTLIGLFELEVNVDVAPEMFEFTPPPGSDVVGSPLVSDATDQ